VEVTLKDIARKTNVSLSAVSKILNPKGGKSLPFSAETRLKVLDTAQEMGYRPNRLARGLKGGKTHTIGVLAFKLLRTHIGNELEKLDTLLAQKGYRLLLGLSQKDDRTVQSQLYDLLSHRVDGVIVTAIEHSFDFIASTLERSGVPFVLHDYCLEFAEGLSVKADMVIPDREEATYRLVDHLIDVHGCKTILYIGVKDQRWRGYDRAMRGHDLGGGEDLVLGLEAGLNDDDDRDVSREAADGFTAFVTGRGRVPEAVVTSCDSLSMKVWQRAVKMGFRVPQDIKIVGFDSFEIMQMLPVPLTTTERHLTVVEKTVDCLVRAIENGMPERKTIHKVPMELRIGESCGCEQS
jgi:LacI family transcriptional regulator